MFDLNILKELYLKNENLVEYMRNQSETAENTAEQIMISYDLQAGSYTENYYKNPKNRIKEAGVIAEVIKEKGLFGSLLEADVGEASTLVPLLNLLQEGRGQCFDSVYGFDVSWSRIKAAKQFAKDQNHSEICFFTGDLLSIPLLDNSIDVVYTCDAIEPNGGKEKEILKELYRVCRKYLILREPCYEYAGEKARARMRKHGYITKLYRSAEELGCMIERYGLCHSSPDDINPEGLMIIRKVSSVSDQTVQSNTPNGEVYACAISKRPLKNCGDSFYCPDSMLAYPVIQGIPCLLPGNAVVATKYESNFKK